MISVYVLESSDDYTWYIGFTTDLRRRIDEHNQGIGGLYTRRAKGTWRLIYNEQYVDKRDAVRRERFLKSGSGHRYLRQQLQYYLNTPT